MAYKNLELILNILIHIFDSGLLSSKISIYYSYLEKVPEIDINDDQQIIPLSSYLFLS